MFPIILIFVRTHERVELSNRSKGILENYTSYLLVIKEVRLGRVQFFMHSCFLNLGSLGRLLSRPTIPSRDAPNLALAASRAQKTRTDHQEGWALVFQTTLEKRHYWGKSSVARPSARRNW